MIFSAIRMEVTLDENLTKFSANSYVNDINAEKAGVIAAGISLGVDIEDIDRFYDKVVDKLRRVGSNSEAMYRCFIEAAYEIRMEGD